MDKKSIIGLVLIFGIFVGYMWWVSPSAEERAKMEAERQHMLDSMANAQRVADSVAAVQARLDSLAAAGDSTALAANDPKAMDMGVFGLADQTEAQTYELYTDLMNIHFSNLGASINSLVLNEYMTYDSNELWLITPSDDNLNLVFSTADNRVVNTKDLVFTPYLNGTPWNDLNSAAAVKGDDSTVVSFRAELANSLHEGYLEFRYTVRGNS